MTLDTAKKAIDFAVNEAVDSGDYYFQLTFSQSILGIGNGTFDDAFYVFTG